MLVFIIYVARAHATGSSVKRTEKRLEALRSAGVYTCEQSMDTFLGTCSITMPLFSLQLLIN